MRGGIGAESLVGDARGSEKDEDKVAKMAGDGVGVERVAGRTVEVSEGSLEGREENICGVEPERCDGEGVESLQASVWKPDKQEHRGPHEGDGNIVQEGVTERDEGRGGTFDVTAYIARIHAFRGGMVDETGCICRDREHRGNDEQYHAIPVGV